MKMCECGCGLPAPVPRTSQARGSKVCGQPRRFVSGHNGRVRPEDPTPLWQRILNRCERIGDCLVWQGCVMRGGYGVIVFRRKPRLVHRAVYEHFYGPIPVGYEVDHVYEKGCRHTGCCNPEHLEAVTPKVNVMRSHNFAGNNARKTHCIHGHELAGDNLLPGPLSRKGHRQCRACAQAYRRVR